MNTRMVQVIHIIGAILVNYVTIVVVVPTNRPSFVVPKPIAAILEAVITADELGTSHAEGVVVSEMGAVVGVGNTAIVAVITVTAVAGIRLGPLGALRLCLALCCLGALWLLLTLSRLGALRLLLTLRRLGALRLRLTLCLLGTLWLRLVLCLLGVLRLSLMFGLRCFSSTTALSLIAFLCECRKGNTEEH